MVCLLAGVVFGAFGAFAYFGHVSPARAGNDRFEDYIMCTGPVAVTPKSITDGLWILDYRSGRLMGTVIDRSVGRILGWADVDLTTEFGIPPRQNVHFLMTTGNIAFGQAAIYVAETTTGKVGVYTMGPRPDGTPGVAIRRHDMVLFRQPAANPAGN
jgi:hypothetical protein